MADPYPKSKQLARGERRYRRKVASPKQWQAIIAAKRGRCRCYAAGTCSGPTCEYHHVVKRSHGGGDVADNIVPLCHRHHDLVTFSPGGASSTALLVSLSDAEYAYMIDKGGEDYPERAYGIRYAR